MPVITRDEARILSALLMEHYDSLLKDTDYKILDGLCGYLLTMQNRLHRDGIDSRRCGRTSLDSMHDLKKRLAEKHNQEQAKKNSK
jgi:hypothetical protein